MVVEESKGSITRTTPVEWFIVHMVWHCWVDSIYICWVEWLTVAKRRQEGREGRQQAPHESSSYRVRNLAIHGQPLPPTEWLQRLWLHGVMKPSLLWPSTMTLPGGGGWITVKGQYQISEDAIGPQGLPILITDRTVTNQELGLKRRERDLYDIRPELC